MRTTGTRTCRTASGDWPTCWGRGEFMTRFLLGLLLLTVAAPLRADGPRVPLLSDAEAWRRLPEATEGAGKPLPAWARALAGALPRTTAAVLELDYLQRARSPLGPALRAKMRWVAARA